MKVLHIIRKLSDVFPHAMIAEHAGENEVSVVYLHDAVYRPQAKGVPAYALNEDLEARGVFDGLTPISYDDLVRMIFESDRILSW